MVCLARDWARANVLSSMVGSGVCDTVSTPTGMVWPDLTLRNVSRRSVRSVGGHHHYHMQGGQTAPLHHHHHRTTNHNTGQALHFKELTRSRTLSIFHRVNMFVAGYTLIFEPESYEDDIQCPFKVSCRFLNLIFWPQLSISKSVYFIHNESLIFLHVDRLISWKDLQNPGCA